MKIKLSCAPDSFTQIPGATLEFRPKNTPMRNSTMRAPSSLFSSAKRFAFIEAAGDTRLQYFFLLAARNLLRSAGWSQRDRLCPEGGDHRSSRWPPQIDHASARRPFPASSASPCIAVTDASNVPDYVARDHASAFSLLPSSRSFRNLA